MSHRTKIQKILQKNGYVLIRNKRHFVYRNETTGQTVIVPNHNKMNPITFKKIVKEIEISA